jgi:hypothetical protein
LITKVTVGLLVIVTLVSAANATQTAARFAEILRSKMADPSYGLCAHFCKPSLLKIVRKNQTEIDLDPVCQCQGMDTGYTVASVLLGTGGTYRAHFMMRGYPNSVWTLVLKPSGATWKIADVIDAKGTSLMATYH